MSDWKEDEDGVWKREYAFDAEGSVSLNTQQPDDRLRWEGSLRIGIRRAHSDRLLNCQNIAMHRRRLSDAQEAVDRAWECLRHPAMGTKDAP